MTLRLNGSTSGYVEIDAPATAGSNTLVLPTGNGNADQALVTNGSGTLSFADRGRIVQGTAQASTSGTSIDFTGIPSWVKRVTVMFRGVSTNGTSVILIQLGTSSGFVSSGYLGASTSSTPTSANYTTGIGIGSNAAANIIHGNALIALADSSANAWTASGIIAASNAAGAWYFGGSIALSGTLDRIRITTVNGTDTFDAGSINIMYEG